MQRNSFKGRGGGGGASNAADSLFSTDAFEFVLGISEGPIGGIVGDTPEERLQNIFIDDVPVYNSLEESNFDDSSLLLRFENGSQLTAAEDAEEGQTPIWYALGGQNITKSVSATLAYLSTVTQITPQTVSGFDEIELRFTIAQLVRYTDDGSKEHSVTFSITLRNILSEDTQTYPITVTGKTTTSPFVRSHKIVLPRTAPEDQFEIEVTRFTRDDDDEEIAVVSWTSYELLTRAGDAYTANGAEYDDPDLEYHSGLSMLQVFGVLGQQLDSIPTINANYHGIECAIPSNYDPITKTYTETEAWNGQFKAKKHWTDNPFWIAYELIMNPRWGMVRYNPRVTANRYEVYRMAKYADGYDLDTGEKNLTNPITGESEAARYTFNVVIQQPSNGWSVLKYVLGSAFARPIETDIGEIKFIADLPELPVATITPEMCMSVTDGSPFSYNFSAISERHNAITSSYIDRDMDYKQQYVGEIRDEADILKYGLNEHVFEAAGATEVWEVKRRMTFYLSSITSEIRTVNFTSMLSGLQFEPMDIINIADPTTGHAFTGRAVKLIGRKVTVRDPVYFDAEGTYNVTIMGKYENYEFETQISTSQIEEPVYTLTLNASLPELDKFNKYAPVVVSAGSLGQTIGLPKPWRIIRVDESDDIAGAFQVTAQEVNLNKHVDADNLIVSETPKYSFLNRPEVRKVENLRVVDEEHFTVNGVEQINLWIAWEAGATLPPGGYYEVKVSEQSLNGREFLTKTVNTYFEIQNVKAGEVKVEVRAVQGDNASPYVLLEWSTNRVSVSDLLAQGVVPQFTMVFENHTLNIESAVYYDFGTAERSTVDLLDNNGLLGIQFKIYNDINPDNRVLLLEKITKSSLSLTKSDFEVLMAGADLPSDLYITARVMDLSGDYYPDLFQGPFAYQMSSPADPITGLAYEYLFSDETPHLLTWDDTNYAYEVTLYKASSNSVVERRNIYESTVNFGVLTAGEEYKVSVRGYTNTLEYGKASSVNFTVSAPATPPAVPTITNEGGIITLTPPKVERISSYYEFKYHGENDIAAAKDYSNGDTITLYSQEKDQEFNIWYRLRSPEGYGSWVHKVVVATAAFQVNLDEILNNENAPWGQSLSKTITKILADLQTWETATSSLGETYESLMYNVTQVDDANKVTKLDVIALRTKVGDETVQTQIANNNIVQIGYEDDDGNWVMGAPLARAFTELKIKNLDGNELSVVNYMQALENAMGQLEGSYYLGVVDENTEFTGLEIKGGNNESAIKLYMDNLQFASKEGITFFELNTTTGKLEIGADTEFLGVIRNNRVIKVGATNMYVEDLDGFGPDNLQEWKGPVMLDANGEPDWANLTKRNATLRWADTVGNEYFGGSISSGILKNSGTATLLGLNPDVTIGPFATNGNPKTVNISFIWTGLWNSDEVCPTSDQVTPSATVQLQRSLGGGDWITLQTLQVTGEMNYTELNEPEISTKCVVKESTRFGSTYTDTHTSTATFTYRLVVSNQQRYLDPTFITYQGLGLTITEEPQ